jgi:putative FmdB family regulatory protein
MPIYAYRCTTCGHAKDVLQKMSDPVLVQCPACGASTFAKQVTAAGFQLKGSGWYVTDFRGGNKPAGDKADAKADGASTESAKGDAAKSDPAKGEAAATAEKPAGAKSDTAPAPAPAAAPPAPASGAK